MIFKLSPFEWTEHNIYVIALYLDHEHFELQ